MADEFVFFAKVKKSADQTKVANSNRIRLVDRFPNGI
jgi:hypothetical protein